METKEIFYQGKTAIPIIAEADVLVIGGGPGGMAAAVMAARQGVKVILAERYGAPGGAVFYNEVTPFMDNMIQGFVLDRPIYIEWNQRIWQYLHPGQEFNEKILENNPVSKEAAMLAAEDMLLEAKVGLLYHHSFFDVVMDGEKISAAIFHSKSGLVAVAARSYVDATGDGDVAYAAHVPFEYGNQDGYCQPMSLCFKLSNVDKSRIPSREEITKRYLQAKQAGQIHCPREDVLMFDATESDTVHFNTTRIIKKSAVNGVELSEAEIEGRRQMREMILFLREQIPGFENAMIRSVGNDIGIRESRRIKGEYYMTEQDFISARKFEDGIARARYHIDIHNPLGSGTTYRRLPLGEWYEISFRALKPLHCSNLLMGCRAISADHAIFSSLRIMPSVCSIGQAAGMGAALAVQKQIQTNQLDGVEVKQRLIQAGAPLL